MKIFRMLMSKPSQILLVLSACAVISHSALAKENILSLENLERERAAFLQDFLDPNLDALAKASKIQRRQAQLSDMERMVIRDERLLNTTNRSVKQAFDSYNLTFLVHAGAEENRDAAEQWLSAVNLSNENILNTRVGYRK